MRRTGWLCPGLAVAVLGLALVGVADAAPGDLDTSFGSGTGFSRVDFGGDESGNAVALQPDGKIVVAGSDTAAGDIHLLVARLNANGGLDLSYGHGTGGSRPDYGHPQSASGVAVQGDGKIVAAGSTSFSPGNDLFATRFLNPEGDTDLSFAGGAGFLEPNFGGANELLSAAALQPDGKIILAGSSEAGGVGGPYRFLLARLTAEGTLDKSYGLGSGGSRPDFGSGDLGSAVALQPDGRIVEAGSSVASASGSADFMVVRYLNPEGVLDPSLGGSAKRVLVDFGGNDVAHAVALQPDGKILLAGTTATKGGTDLAVARLLPDGSPDNSFGEGSRMIIDLGGEDHDAAMALQPDGKIVLAGSRTVGSAGQDIAVVRLQPGGTPDSTFGNAGKKIIDLGGEEGSRAIALRPDGRIVLAGTSVNSGKTDMLVVSLLGDAAVGAGGPAGGGPGSGGGAAGIPKCEGRKATIVGTNGANRLTGTAHADVIVGLGGNDKIKGGGGNDLICGGDGNDKIEGGAGKDRLYGQKGNDRIAGGAGNDVIGGGPGKDLLLGQGGNDRIAGGAGKDRISGGTGKNNTRQ